MKVTAFLLAIGPASLIVTKLVDTVRNLFDAGNTYPKAVWTILPFVIGVGYALGWQLNFSGLVPLPPALAETLTPRLTGVAGQVLTGLAFGASAGFWHDLLSLWANKARAATS